MSERVSVRLSARGAATAPKLAGGKSESGKAENHQIGLRKWDLRAMQADTHTRARTRSQGSNTRLCRAHPRCTGTGLRVSACCVCAHISAPYTHPCAHTPRWRRVRAPQHMRVHLCGGPSMQCTCMCVRQGLYTALVPNGGLRGEQGTAGSPPRPCTHMSHRSTQDTPVSQRSRCTGHGGCGGPCGDTHMPPLHVCICAPNM